MSRCSLPTCASAWMRSHSVAPFSSFPSRSSAAAAAGEESSRSTWRWQRVRHVRSSRLFPTGSVTATFWRRSASRGTRSSGAANSSFSSRGGGVRDRRSKRFSEARHPSRAARHPSRARRPRSSPSRFGKPYPDAAHTAIALSRRTSRSDDRSSSPPRAARDSGGAASSSSDASDASSSESAHASATAASAREAAGADYSYTGCLLRARQSPLGARVYKKIRTRVL